MKRYLMISGGVLAVALGVVGIVIPLLPTTPFLLLAAFLFSKSSEKFHRKLMENKILGEYIYNYSEKKGLKKREKIISLGTLWGGIIFSFIKISNNHGKIFLLIVLAGVTYHLLKLKTLKN